MSSTGSGMSSKRKAPDAADPAHKAAEDPTPNKKKASKSQGRMHTATARVGDRDLDRDCGSVHTNPSTSHVEHEAQQHKAKSDTARGGGLNIGSPRRAHLARR